MAGVSARLVASATDRGPAGVEGVVATEHQLHVVVFAEGDGRPQVVETILIHQADFATFNPLVMLRAGQLIE